MRFLLANWSYPQIIISDQDAKFTGEFWNSLWNLTYKIKTPFRKYQIWANDKKQESEIRNFTTVFNLIRSWILYVKFYKEFQNSHFVNFFESSKFGGSFRKFYWGKVRYTCFITSSTLNSHQISLEWKCYRPRGSLVRFGLKFVRTQA